MECCYLCGQPAEDLASITVPQDGLSITASYCHEGESPTCYMLATWAQQVPILGGGSDWFISLLERPHPKESS